MRSLVRLTRRYLGRGWSNDETGAVFTRKIKGHGIIKMYGILGIRVLDLRETNPPLSIGRIFRIAHRVLRCGLIVTPCDDGSYAVYNHEYWRGAIKFDQCRGKQYLWHGLNPSPVGLRLYAGTPLTDMVQDALAVREDKSA